MKKRFHALVTAILVLYLTLPTLSAWALSSADALMNFGMMPELANYISTKLISVNSSGNVVIPVATSKALSVTVGGTEKMAMAASGAVTHAAGITATTGDITATAGEFIASTSGKTLALQEATGAAACSGTATANGTTAVTVTTTCATTGSRIFISATSDGTGAAANDQGACWTTNIVNGTSFDLDCPDANNNATYNWIIFHEAA